MKYLLEPGFSEMAGSSDGSRQPYTTDQQRHGGDFNGRLGDFNRCGDLSGRFNRGGELNGRGGGFNVRGGELSGQLGELNGRGGELTGRLGEFNYEMSQPTMAGQGRMAGNISGKD